MTWAWLGDAAAEAMSLAALFSLSGIVWSVKALGLANLNLNPPTQVWNIFPCNIKEF